MTDEVICIVIPHDGEAAAADVEPVPGFVGKVRTTTTRNGTMEGGIRNDEGEKNKRPRAPFMHLFRFTTPAEKVMILVGAICACAHGALLPILAIVFGSVIQTFIVPVTSGSDLASEVGSVAKVRCCRLGQDDFKGDEVDNRSAPSRL
jgi:hypothetical protein